MSPTQQQRPDGSWAPAVPLGYQPGYDIERTRLGWTLYRTTREDSVKVASGRTTAGMILAYGWRRVLRPIR
jgi:hypothetical protein